MDVFDQNESLPPGPEVLVRHGPVSNSWPLSAAVVNSSKPGTFNTLSLADNLLTFPRCLIGAKDYPVRPAISAFHSPNERSR